MSNNFLLTGALGCIGAWAVRNLVQAGASVTVFDLGTDLRRLRLIMSEDELAQVAFVQGDVTDFAQVQRVVMGHGISHVLHLAGLQVPACRANPVLGAQVNVVGTVNIFEAAKQSNGQVQRIVFASSAAVFDVDDARPEKYWHTMQPGIHKPCMAYTNWQTKVPPACMPKKTASVRLGCVRILCTAQAETKA